MQRATTLCILYFAEVIRLGIYIHFTEEQKQQAASADLEAFLRSRGERLLASGRDKRLASDHSITIRGSEWYDHADERGGNAISFVQRYYNVGYAEAVTMLLGSGCEVAINANEQPMLKKVFALPEANRDMRRVFAYLGKTRGIDNDVLSHFAKAHLIYEEAIHHNAVFVGMDERGIPRHAHMRSTNSSGKSFRINVEGSEPRHSFNYTGNDGRLFVFESPIDLLSYISMDLESWQAHSYVACCGVSIKPVLEQLRRNDISCVYLCLDNDDAGQRAARRMETQLLGMGLKVEIQMPKLKDRNEDLLEVVQR